MILSSLVNPDPEGFVRLDENLGRHIGASNVDAFHAEAGDVTINECLNNNVVVREMMRHPVINEELQQAIGVQYAAPRVGQTDAALMNMALTQRFTANMVEPFPSIQVRAIVANEILVNPAINDAMIRNPVIMRELTNAVTKLYATRSAEFEGGGSTSGAAGRATGRGTKRARGARKRG